MHTHYHIHPPLIHDLLSEEVQLEPAAMTSRFNRIALSSARRLLSFIVQVLAGAVLFFAWDFPPCCRATCLNHPAWLKGSIGRSHASNFIAARSGNLAGPVQKLGAPPMLAKERVRAGKRYRGNLVRSRLRKLKWCVQEKLRVKNCPTVGES